MKLTWSFSSLKQYTTCPRQYHEIRILKNYETSITEQMQYGTEVHKALEEYVRDGKPLPEFYQRFKPCVDTLLQIPGKKLTEYEMALDQEMNPIDFSNENRWVRGIADLVILDEPTAFVVDYKTGSSRYPDTKQLKLMALMIFAHFPEVQIVKGGLLFVLHNAFVTDDYHRKDINKHWESFDLDLRRLKHSMDTDTWHPIPNNFCRSYCAVKTCEHNGKSSGGYRRF